MSMLIPIQELRYNLAPRLAVGGLPAPPYKYAGYLENRIMPRGADNRNAMLEQRRIITKDAENVRLIQDRPFQ